MKTKTDTRQRIIDAATEVMREKGIARTTTKEIASRANCSEGTLYNHFGDKEEIFLSMLREQFPSFIPFLRELPGKAGEQPVATQLREVATRALDFYDQIIPMSASFFSERDLLSRYRQFIQQRGVGPHRANQAVARYLEAERRLGNLPGHLDPATTADLLLGACLIRAYWRQFLGDKYTKDEDTEFVDGLITTLVTRTG